MLSTFGLDFTDESLTTEYAKSFNAFTESIIELDLSGCIIDYEAMSAIMDAIIKQLDTRPAPKHLNIVFNIKFQKRLFLKWLFMGSKELHLNIKVATDELIEATVISEFKKRQINLTISIADQEAQTLTPIIAYAY